MSEDLETAQLDDLSVRGGWRLLCVGVLHDAVQRIAESRNLYRKARGPGAFSSRAWGIQQQDSWHEAERWLGGGVGVITFEDCCELMGVTPAIARRKIEEYAYARRREKPANVPW